MNWEQYSKRRSGMSLQEFLVGCTCVEDAIIVFNNRKVEPPLEELEKFFKKPEPVVVSTSTQEDLQTDEENALTDQVSQVTATSVTKKSKA